MIKINEKYFIDSDKLNWILKEKRVIDPKHPRSKSNVPVEKFIDIGYYGKIEHLINRLINDVLRGEECKSIQDLKESLYRFENKLKIEVKEKVSEKVRERKN